MNEVYSLPSEALDRFVLPDAELTPEDVAMFQRYYGIDITELSATEMTILSNYAKHGATATIMDMIARISKGEKRKLTSILVAFIWGSFSHQMEKSACQGWECS